jgi:hypothetical protein
MLEHREHRDDVEGTRIVEVVREHTANDAIRATELRRTAASRLTRFARRTRCVRLAVGVDADSGADAAAGDAEEVRVRASDVEHARPLGDVGEGHTEPQTL